MNLNHMSANPISSASAEVRKRFMNELTRAIRGGVSEIKAVDLHPYKTAIEEFLDGEELLSDDLIKSKVDQLANERYLEVMFPPGYIFCPALLAFSNMGGRLDENEILNGDHVVNLLIDPKTTQTISGYGATPSMIFHILPPEVQDIAFVIPPYSPNDRTPFLNAYRDACVKLQKLLAATN